MAVTSSIEPSTATSYGTPSNVQLEPPLPRDVNTLVIAALSAMGFAVQFSWAAGESVAIPYLVEVGGMGIQKAGLIYVFNPILSLLLQPIIGSRTDGAGRMPYINTLAVIAGFGLTLTILTRTLVNIFGATAFAFNALVFLGFNISDCHKLFKKS